MPLSRDDYRTWEAERREREALPQVQLHRASVNDDGEILHTPMSRMHGRIVDRLAEKYDGYTFTVEDTSAHFDFLDFPHPLYFGSTSWSSPTTKQKWIDSQQAFDIGLPFPVTPPDVARAYVGLKFPNRRARLHADQYDACVKQSYSVPAYADPCSLYDGACYIDLQSAFWQIVRAVGWNVEYLPRTYLGAGDDMTDFPFRWQKLTRNCLVSIGVASGKINYWTGHEMAYVTPGSQFANRVLWRLVCDVLNGVAFDVVQAGARYVCIDGYICSGVNSFAVAEAIEAWGLRYSFKHHGAFGTVRGVGSYRVGDYASKPYRQSIRSGRSARIYDPGVEWLRPRFKKLAEKADQDWLFYRGLEGYDD